MKKILVACDDRALSILYSMELAEEGYHTVVVSDPRLVTKSLEKDRPDLVLVDWSMDRYRDSHFPKTVQEDPDPIPVLHCLDYPPTQQDRQVLWSDHFVLKNSNLKELKSAIKNIWKGEPLVQVSGRPPAVAEAEMAPSTQIPFDWE